MMKKSEECDFQWIELSKGKDARGQQLYESCMVNDALISSGDYVLINNYDDPENENTAYIAKIVKMFHSEAKRTAPHRATVSWFARLHDMPAHVRNKFPLTPASPPSPSCRLQEIFLNTMNFENNIDLETVLKKIYVTDISREDNTSKTGMNYDSSCNNHFVFKGRVYDGKSITDEKNKENQNDGDDGFNLISRSGRKLKKVVMDLSPDVNLQKNRRASTATDGYRGSCKKSLFASATTPSNSTALSITCTPSARSTRHSSTAPDTPSSKHSNDTPRSTAARRKSTTNLQKSSSAAKAKPKLKVTKNTDDGDDVEYDDLLRDDDGDDDEDDDSDYNFDEADLSGSSTPPPSSPSVSSDGDGGDGRRLPHRRSTRSKKKFTKIKNRKQTSRTNSVYVTRSDGVGEFITGCKLSSISLKDKSNLQLIRERLHLAVVPDDLPCREEEFADIYQFIRNKIIDRSGGCMYISGVPGTGKTATVRQVMSILHDEHLSGDLAMFKYIEVNGMKLVDPHHANVEILKQLTGQKATAEHACNLLDRRFKTEDPHRVPVVLLVDELDLLWTRKQTVMYNLFDWPSYKYSQLIVIAIANTMDLPERMLMSRVASRLGLTRLTFQPYNHHQLQEIVLSRIQGFDAFHEDAVQLVARKVAAVSGDARRALEICRRATELVTGKEQFISMVHVDAAIQEMFSAPCMVAVRTSSFFEKMFLKSLLSEFQRTGIEEAVLANVYTQFVALCRFEGVTSPNLSQVSRMCNKLGGFKLLLTDSSRNDIHQKIRLNMSQDDLSYALKQDNS
ncbi:hypothetical protein HELRODRAFT_103086 [Helobdella robusta]|uniref:Origin recognition complex subunit 1 n=1 Tax=Helobdella robusta TaxID=6412 RepID=T1EDE2_HELRO|nr:hypothetical protein HELRODRAFT_103086 [Helobdella robusta]ESN93994.1 hypothetical protein HELRODRAFT_103086 [Helobdella robusta]